MGYRSVWSCDYPPEWDEPDEDEEQEEDDPDVTEDEYDERYAFECMTDLEVRYNQ